MGLGGIIQDPLAPAVLDGIEQKPPRPLPCIGGEGLPPPGRGGIEGYPSILGEPDLYPGVGLVLGDGQVISELAPFTSQEPVDLTGQDALGSKKNGHRRGEVLAMTGSAGQEKVFQRRLPGGPGELQRVGEFCLKPAFQGDGPVVICGQAGQE